MDRGPGGAGAKRCIASRRILRTLHGQRPIVRGVLRRHKLGGLLKACVSTLPGLIGPGAKRVRASFGRAVATANHLDDDGPGLRGVPIHGRRNGRVQGTFVPRPNYRFFSTSCSRVRLHVVTRLDNSPRVRRTFHRNRSVRTTATTGVCGGPVRRIAQRRQDGTGATGFNVVCNVAMFKLTRQVGMGHTRTGRLVSNCFVACPGIGRCVRGDVRATHRGNCARAVCRHHYCLHSVGDRGTIIHNCTRHGTVGTPVRKDTTSVVGVTVATIFHHFRGRKLHSGVVLRMRSRLGFDIFPRRQRHIRAVIVRRVRQTYAVRIPLRTSCN